MYLQSLENAFELTKVAKTKDDVSLAKATVYAQIAMAIGTSMLDEESADKTIPVQPDTASEVVTEKESPEEKTVVIPVTTEEKKDIPVPPLPPDRFEDEDEAARNVRYEYLLSKYGDTPMGELPKEAYAYLTPEVNVNKIYEWLWNDELKDDASKRKESIIREYSQDKYSDVYEIPLSMYLQDVIPSEQDWIYFMMFENADTINDVLAKCTNNKYKDYRVLTNQSAKVWRVATEKYMQNNFAEIEKVS